MEVTFNQGYGSSARTVKVRHGYRCVVISIDNENDENEPVKVELPTDQLLAIVKCYRTMEKSV